MKWHFADLPNPDPARVLPDQSPTPNTLQLAKREEAKKAKLKRPSAKSAIKTRILRIGQGKSGDEDQFIQETAVLVLEHIERTSDCSSVLELIDALPPNDPRKVKLRDWFERFSPVRITRPWESAKLLEKGRRSFAPFDITGAKEKMFWRMPVVNEWLVKSKP